MKYKIPLIVLALILGFFLVRYLDSERSNSIRRKEGQVSQATYQNVTWGISFNYPSAFKLTDSFIRESESVWKTNSTTTGVRMVEIRTPETYMVGTNFNGAWFHAGYTDDPQEVTSCLMPINETSAGDTAINGVTYTKFSATGAAAGNRYDTTSYRTIRNNRCYAVEYTIHSSNINNFDQNSNIQEFDKQEITKTLETIARSFKFTK